MKLIGLDKKIYSIDLIKKEYQQRTEDGSKSKIQFECGQYLKEKFPCDTILEEVIIPGSKLRIDFLIPTKKIAFEIQGEQHDKYVPFFHGSQKGFIKSKNRDEDKAKFCSINNISLYYIRSLEEIKELL